MGIARIARGTAQAKDIALGVSSLSSASFAASAGSTLVAIYSTIVGGLPDAVTWGATSLSLVLQQGNLSVFAAYNVGAGTNAIVADTSVGLPTAISGTFIEITGCTTAPLDKTAMASGSSTAPSSGASATTSQANELVIGCLSTNGPNGDTAPTWSNGFTAGQRLGNSGGTATSNVTTADSYLIVSSAAAYTAAATGITSRAWDAAVLTFKEAASAVTVTPASFEADTSVPAATTIAGPVTAALSSKETDSGVPAVTMLEGVVVVHPASLVAEARATLPQEMGGTVGFDVPAPQPVATTPQGMQDGVSAGPVTIRANTAALKDGSLATFVATATPLTWPSSGTLTIDPHGYAQTAILGTGVITGVVFYLLARLKKDAGCAITNPRVFLASGHQPALSAISTGPTGAPFASFAETKTALVTTSDGTTPWDWATIFNALLNARWQVDYNQPSNPDFAVFEVAEGWIEVFGPVGAEPDVIALRQDAGKTIRFATRSASKL